jgi:tetratricopeptide (TPR) repeat protein
VIDQHKATRVARRCLLGAALLLAPCVLRAQDPADTDSSPYHQALLNYKSGNYPAARLAIDDAEKANPGNLAVEILKSRILVEQHEFAEGEALLRKYLTANGPFEVQLALGDLLMRERQFSAAANMYTQALDLKPNDPDLILKLIYTKVNTADLVTAEKYASQLKPLDPVNPAYYFAKAAIATSTGKSTEADEDIQTVRTIYGITVANHYLKTFLEVFAAKKDNPAVRAEPPSTNAPPAQGP